MSATSGCRTQQHVRCRGHRCRIRHRAILSFAERQARCAKGTAGSTATSADSCGPPGEDSTKVPQPARTRPDGSARCGTVTCGDGLRWMACLLMACKRSGVRIFLDPPGQLHNSNNLKRDFEWLVALPGAILDPLTRPGDIR